MAEDRDDDDVFWVDPETRGVLPLDRFHVSRSLKKTIRSGRFKISVNYHFRSVIEACAESTSHRPNSWINDSIINVYCELQNMGHAHSVECWDGKKLVGVLYGVSLGAAFFGESMFSRISDASKVALFHLVGRLKHGGFKLLDTQFITPHLAKLGAEEMGRKIYLDKLQTAIKSKANFCSLSYSPSCGVPPTFSPSPSL